MTGAATLWSFAGIGTRQLESAQGFEVTFWRSLFTMIFVGVFLLWRERRSGARAFSSVRKAGGTGMISGLMWGTMFTAFMMALTMTTVANALIVMSVAPLLTALLAWCFLRQAVLPRTWLAIAIAFAGMVWMFSGSLAVAGGAHLAGMAVAFLVPLSTATNVVLMKKAGKDVDLMPAVMLGGLFSAAVMLPLALPFSVSAHDVVVLALLAVFQLGLPCLMVVAAARTLSAPEISLLGLTEVLLGPLWTWLGAGEVPAQQTLVGGAIVIAALALNEIAAMRAAAVKPAGATPA
jgi:drug/metabolite transporter (DMT)-like permease